MAGIEGTSMQATRVIDGWWDAEVVYFPPDNACANERIGADPTVIRGTQEQFYKTMAALDGKDHFPPKTTTLKVLITRRNKKAHHIARVIVNHDKVVNIIKQVLWLWDVETFSDLKVPDAPTTCRMFATANIIIGHYTILYYAILILYCTALYCTALYCTVLYYTILCYTILY